MMTLDEIRGYYPPILHDRSEFLLREYLQYKILDSIFQSEYASKFVFLGGTCLRIVHNTQRFSEDLDFDNFDLTEDDFKLVTAIIQEALEADGFEVTIRHVFKGAFHCYVRFPGLLYQAGLSPHKEAKILIKLDTEPQHFDFESDLVFLNKFDIFTEIRATPIDILLSQKITAITGRKRPKGRDFYDVIFLTSKTKPNYDFLEKRLNITDSDSLKSHLIKVCKNFDFEELAKDVMPFLFNVNDKQRILLFPKYIQTVEW